MRLTKESKIWAVCLSLSILTTLTVFGTAYVTHTVERDQRIHRERCDEYRERRAWLRWIGGLE